MMKHLFRRLRRRATVRIYRYARAISWAITPRYVRLRWAADRAYERAFEKYMLERLQNVAFKEVVVFADEFRPREAERPTLH